MVDFAAFLVLELLVATALFAALGALVTKCRAADEWNPRGLRDAERDGGVEDRWR